MHFSPSNHSTFPAPSRQIRTFLTRSCYLWIIILIIILFCCCGNGFGGCGNGCGNGCGDGCGCGC